MKILTTVSVCVLIATSTAFAQQLSAGRGDLMSSVPTSSVTVTEVQADRL